MVMMKKKKNNLTSGGSERRNRRKKKKDVEELTQRTNTTGKKRDELGRKSRGEKQKQHDADVAFFSLFLLEAQQRTTTAT